MSLSKANKQKNEQKGQDMYFFLLCFLNLPRSPKETGNAPMHYSIVIKKRVWAEFAAAMLVMLTSI